MRILLVGNFKPDQQESMARFCELIRNGMVKFGHTVDVLRPESFFARMPAASVAMKKWLGYLDKYLLFPFILRRRAKLYDLISICDHSNSLYTRYLGNKPNVVTCHDLLAIRSALGEIQANPTGWSGRILQREILRGLKRAQHVICVSEKTKLDLLRLAPRDPERVSLILNGLNYLYAPMENVEARNRIRSLLKANPGSEFSRPFFLHVGGNQWYKNRLGVLKIFASLRRQPEFHNHLLIMAGKPFTAEMRALVQSDALYADVVELRSVSNEELCALYSTADGLLFPSLEEGFGWPIVEAQACGCPVFTSNRPPMTEVGGDAAVYFDPSNPDAAAAIVAESTGRRSAIVAAGLANARRFEAGKMLEQYRQVYERAAETALLSS